MMKRFTILLPPRQRGLSPISPKVGMPNLGSTGVDSGVEQSLSSQQELSDDGSCNQFQWPLGMWSDSNEFRLDGQEENSTSMVEDLQLEQGNMPGPAQRSVLSPSEDVFIDPFVAL